MSNTTNHWEKIKPNQTPGTAKIDERFWASLKAGDIVLEVGSGSGRVIDLCLSKNLKVIGLDINEIEINNLKQKYLRSTDVKLMVADITKVIHLEQKVNAVMMLGLLGALDNPKQRSKALANCSFVLNNNSEMVISEFLYTPEVEVLAKRYEEGAKLGLESGSFNVYDEDGSIHYKTHNFKLVEITQLINEHFEVLSCEEKVFLSFHGNKRRGVSIRARKK